MLCLRKMYTYGMEFTSRFNLYSIRSRKPMDPVPMSLWTVSNVLWTNQYCPIGFVIDRWSVNPKEPILWTFLSMSSTKMWLDISTWLDSYPNPCSPMPNWWAERGVIINTSRFSVIDIPVINSVSAVNGSGAQVAYSTAMAAIAGMTLPLARGLGRYGIRCVGVEPGLFEIPLIQAYEDTVNILSKLTPFPQRLGKPEEYAQLIEVNPSHRMKCSKLSKTLWLTAATSESMGEYEPKQ